MNVSFLWGGSRGSSSGDSGREPVFIFAKDYFWVQSLLAVLLSLPVVRSHFLGCSSCFLSHAFEQEFCFTSFSAFVFIIVIFLSDTNDDHRFCRLVLFFPDQSGCTGWFSLYGVWGGPLWYLSVSLMIHSCLFMIVRRSVTPLSEISVANIWKKKAVAKINIVCSVSLGTVVLKIFYIVRI